MGRPAQPTRNWHQKTKKTKTFLTLENKQRGKISVSPGLSSHRRLRGLNSADAVGPEPGHARGGASSAGVKSQQ